MMLIHIIAWHGLIGILQKMNYRIVFFFKISQLNMLKSSFIFIHREVGVAQVSIGQPSLLHEHFLATTGGSGVVPIVKNVTISKGFRGTFLYS